MRIENILKSVKKRIRPGKAPLSIKKKLDMINQLLKKNKIKAKAVLGGSFAKNTHLKDDYDIDIFVKFDYSYEKKEISNILDKVLSPLKAERVHGSRDYFQIKNKLSYEIIPVLDVKDVSKARNITDMSPMHVDWVRKNINGKEDEIRLAKLFCKANDIYGAESYIQGISGHVLDILVIYYGNFIKFLEAVTGWKDGKKEKEVIDFYNFYKGEAIRKMNRSKTLSPLIVVDPISPDRNAAAALSTVDSLMRMGFDIPEQAVFSGMKNVLWEGRIQVAGREPLLLIDAAHNTEGMRTLAESIKNLFSYEKMTLVFGVLADKNYTEMLDLIVPLASRIILTKPLSPRALDPGELASLYKFGNTPLEIIEDIPKAWQKAVSEAGRNDLVCGAGSIYFIGEILHALHNQKT